MPTKVAATGSDTPSDRGVIETLLDVDVGDEVFLEASNYAWESPYLVADIDEVVWEQSDGEMRSRTIVFEPDDARGKSRELDIVEDGELPVIGTGYGQLVDVTIRDQNIWCGWCGDGFCDEKRLRDHHDREHDKERLRSLDVEPDLRCDDCNRHYYRQQRYQSHQNTSRCGASLPDSMSEAEFRDLVDESSTILELKRGVRELNRSQILGALEKRDLTDEIATAGSKSPEQLLESLDLDETVDEPEQHPGWLPRDADDVVEEAIDYSIEEFLSIVEAAPSSTHARHEIDGGDAKTVQMLLWRLGLRNADGSLLEADQLNERIAEIRRWYCDG